MKKLLLIALIVFFSGIAVVLQRSRNSSTVTVTEKTIQLMIGSRVFTVDVEPGATALSVLQSAAEREHFTVVVTQQEEWSVFVIDICFEESDSCRKEPVVDCAWGYSVNGSDIVTSPDQYLITAKDTVQWKFECEDK